VITTALNDYNAPYGGTNASDSKSSGGCRTALGAATKHLERRGALPRLAVLVGRRRRGSKSA